MWAHRCLVEKNRLAVADAQLVEETFQAKLATFAARAADTVQQTLAEPEQPSQRTEPIRAQQRADRRPS